MRFYVYAIFDGDAVFYVGKGSGPRLRCQERRFRLPGKIIEECYLENNAFARERYWIEKLKPISNLNRGGSGGRVKGFKRRPRKTKEDILIEHLGTRVFAARTLLAKIDERNAHQFGLSKVDIDRWREVANGPRC